VLLPEWTRQKSWLPVADRPDHYASVLLDGGVSIRAVAQYLGHVDPGFTLRVYSHLMPDTEDRARAAIDAALAPADSVRTGEVED
jgi:integrase